LIISHVFNFTFKAEELQEAPIPEKELLAAQMALLLVVIFRPLFLLGISCLLPFCFAECRILPHKQA